MILFILYAFLLTEIAQCNENKTLLVIGYFRHGARAPNKLFYKSSDEFFQGLGKIDKADVTYVGMSQMYNLGMQYNSYLQQKHVVLNSSDFYISSSYSKRCYVSASYFQFGLAGIQIPNFNISNEYKERFQNLSQTPHQMNAGKFFLGDLTLINRTDEKTDQFFNTDDVCKNYQSIHNEVLRSEEANKLMNDLLPDWLKEQIVIDFGDQLQLRNSSELDLTHVRKVIDIFYSTKFHGTDFPPYPEDVMLSLKSVIFYEARFKNKTLRHMQNYHFFKELVKIADYLLDESGKGSKKFIGYFGHDTNIASIMYDLVGDKNFLSRHDKGVPPFAAYFDLHFYKSSNHQIYVELTYLGEPQNINGCFAQCLVKDFVKIINKIVDEQHFTCEL